MCHRASVKGRSEGAVEMHGLAYGEKRSKHRHAFPSGKEKQHQSCLEGVYQRLPAVSGLHAKRRRHGANIVRAMP